MVSSEYAGVLGTRKVVLLLMSGVLVLAQVDEVVPAPCCTGYPKQKYLSAQGTSQALTFFFFFFLNLLWDFGLSFHLNMLNSCKAIGVPGMMSSLAIGTSCLDLLLHFQFLYVFRCHMALAVDCTSCTYLYVHRFCRCP